MSDIVCECGHGIEIHDEYGCNFPHVTEAHDCACALSKDTVEARYWARRMKRERDELARKFARIVPQVEEA